MSYQFFFICVRSLSAILMLCAIWGFVMGGGGATNGVIDAILFVGGLISVTVANGFEAILDVIADWGNKRKSD